MFRASGPRQRDNTLTHKLAMALVPVSIASPNGAHGPQADQHPYRPVTPLLRDTTVDCLPYVDQQPDPDTRARIEKLVADHAASLPRTESAYLPPTLPPPPTSRSRSFQSNTAPLPPSEERSALDIALASGASATAAYRAELAARFGDAAWRERCEYAEKSLRALRVQREQKESRLGAINRRRAAEQRRVATRLAKLSHKCSALIEDNFTLRNALDRR